MVHFISHDGIESGGADALQTNNAGETPLNIIEGKIADMKEKFKKDKKKCDAWNAIKFPIGFLFSHIGYRKIICFEQLRCFLFRENILTPKP